MPAFRHLVCLLAVFGASPIAIAEESADTEESSVVEIPTCEEIAQGIHPKAVARVVKNHYLSCKYSCKTEKLKGNETPGCKSACKNQSKKDKATVAACNI